MSWKRGNPGCPCCGTATCDCPGGGTSRKFAGTPVLIITIENMLPTYSWETVTNYTFPIGGLRATQYESFTIDGMDEANGTYAWELEKTEEGCLSFPTIGLVDSESFSVPNVSVTHVQRTLSGNFGCTVSSTSNFNPSIAPSLVATRAPGSVAGLYEVVFSISYTQSPQPAWDGQHFYVGAIKRLFCNLDYDADATAGVHGVGPVPGASTQTSRPYASDEVWLAHRHNLVNRCIPFFFFDYDVVGNIYAEIIDDVP